MNNLSKNKNESSTQTLIPVNEVRNNVIILKNGGLRTIVEVDGVNIDLMSPEDQENMLNMWQSFLNNLDFSVQTIVTSKKIQIENYLKNVVDSTKNFEDELLKSQINDYLSFIQDFTNNNPIMEKKYLLVVPYDPIIFKATGFGSQIKDMFLNIFNLNREAFKQDIELSDNEFQKNYRQLLLRQDTVLSQLNRIGLSAKVLTTEEIIALLHNTYNPDSLFKKPASNF